MAALADDPSSVVAALLNEHGDCVALRRFALPVLADGLVRQKERSIRFQLGGRVCDGYSPGLWGDILVVWGNVDPASVSKTTPITSIMSG